MFGELQLPGNLRLGHCASPPCPGLVTRPLVLAPLAFCQGEHTDLSNTALKLNYSCLLPHLFVLQLGVMYILSN